MKRVKEFALKYIDEQTNENEIGDNNENTPLMSVSAKKEFLELTVIDLTNLKMAEAEFAP